MDKNSKAAKLPRPVQDYMKRMYTDTVSPHAAGIEFAIDYYGIDHVMYGTDYPCWDSGALPQADRRNSAIGRRQAEAVLRQRTAYPQFARANDGEARARAGASVSNHCRSAKRSSTLSHLS